MNDITCMSFDYFCNLRGKPKSECKGRYYRCSLTRYLDKRGAYVETMKMVPMRRMSCPGCEECGWIDDELSESYSTYGTSPLFAKEPEHGKLYTIRATNVSHDWESGIVDGWDLEFVEVSEE